MIYLKHGATFISDDLVEEGLAWRTKHKPTNKQKLPNVRNALRFKETPTENTSESVSEQVTDLMELVQTTVLTVPYQMGRAKIHEELRIF